MGWDLVAEFVARPLIRCFDEGRPSPIDSNCGPDAPPEAVITLVLVVVGFFVLMMTQAGIADWWASRGRRRTKSTDVVARADAPAGPSRGTESGDDGDEVPF